MHTENIKENENHKFVFLGFLGWVGRGSGLGSKGRTHLYFKEIVLTESGDDEADSGDDEGNVGRDGGLGGREVVALADDAVGRVRLGDEELALGASQFVLGAAGVDSKLQIKIQ